MWTSENVLLASYSTDETSTRNMAIFWICFTFSFLTGNTIEFFLLMGQTEFTEEIRYQFFIPLTVSAFIGSFIFLFIRKIDNDDDDNGDADDDDDNEEKNQYDSSGSKTKSVSEAWNTSKNILSSSLSHFFSKLFLHRKIDMFLPFRK